MLQWKKSLKTRLFFYLLLTACICGCNRSSALVIDSDIKSVQEICKEILVEQGFQIDIDKAKYVATDWKVRLSPYQQQGRKEKAKIYINPQNTQVKLEVIVAQYINYTTQDYLQEANAVWISSGRNQMQEKWLIALIKNKLLLTK